MEMKNGWIRDKIKKIYGGKNEKMDEKKIKNEKNYDGKKNYVRKKFTSNPLSPLSFSPSLFPLSPSLPSPSPSPPPLSLLPIPPLPPSNKLL